MILNQNDLGERHLYKEFCSQIGEFAKVSGSTFWEHQGSDCIAQDILVTCELSNSLDLGSKASKRFLSQLNKSKPLPCSTKSTQSPTCLSSDFTPYFEPPDSPPFNHSAFLLLLEQTQLVLVCLYKCGSLCLEHSPDLPTFSFYSGLCSSVTSERPPLTTLPLKMLLISPPLPNILHPFIWLYFSLWHLPPNILCMFIFSPPPL